MSASNAIQKLIMEFSMKMQYDEAEVWAEFYLSLDEQDEMARFCLAYVYQLQAKYNAAISLLTGYEGHPNCKYILAQCLFHTKKYRDTLIIIEKLESILELNDYPSFQSNFFNFSLKKADILKLKSQCYNALGEKDLTAQIAGKAFALNASLISSLRMAIFNGYVIDEELIINELKISPVLADMRLTNPEGSDFDWDEVENKPQSKRKRHLRDEIGDLKIAIETSKNIFKNVLKFYSDIIDVSRCIGGNNFSQIRSSSCKLKSQAALYAYSLYERHLFSKAALEFQSLLNQNNFYNFEVIEHYPSILWYLKNINQLTYLAEIWKSDQSTLYFSWIASGNAFSLREDRENAVKSFAKASEISPFSAQPHLLSGYEFLSIEDYQSAEEQFRIAIQKNPNCGKAFLGLGIVNYRRNDFESARKRLEIAVALRPEDFSCYLYIASNFLKLGRIQKALIFTSKAMELKRDEPKTLYLMASILFQQEKFDESLEFFHQLRQIAPLESSVYVGIGRVYLKLNNPNLALNSFTKALELDPQNSSIIDLLEKFQKT